MLTLLQKREILIKFNHQKYSNISDDNIESVFSDLMQYYDIRIPELKSDSIPIKKVIKWNGLSIGVTHNPGDIRYSKTMKVGYGHVRGTFGKAEDSKSIDVYIGDLDNPNLWKVRQLNPKTGEVDELKYFIGFISPKQVKDTFCYHAGADRFGGVEPCNDELNQYRKDAETEEKTVDDWLSIELEEKVSVQIQSWLSTIYKVIQDIGSQYKDDNARQEALEKALATIELPLDVLTNIIYQNRVLADLAARTEVEG